MALQESCFCIRIFHRGWLCWRDGPKMWRWSQNLERKIKIILDWWEKNGRKQNQTQKWNMFLNSPSTVSSAYLLSGVQSGVWHGRPSDCTYMSLSLASRSGGSSESYRTRRSHTVLQQTQISQGSLGACCRGLHRNSPPLRRPGRGGRPAESRQMETVEKRNLCHETVEVNSILSIYCILSLPVFRDPYMIDVS